MYKDSLKAIFFWIFYESAKILYETQKVILYKLKSTFRKRKWKMSKKGVRIISAKEKSRWENDR